MRPFNPQPIAHASTMAMVAARPLKLVLAGAMLLSTSLSTIAASAPPTDAELANASYIGIEDQAITLTDGQWLGQPFSPDGASRPAAGLVEQFRLSGDLDGDGNNETVVLLWSSGGGTGTFSHIAVMQRKDGQQGDGLVNLDTTMIGDRVQVRAGHIADRHIVLDLVQSGPNDPACCPTQLATRSWTLDHGLQEQPVKVTGTLSVAAIGGAGMAGSEQLWQLTEFAADAPVADGIEISLKLDGDKLVGSSGCNRYFAQVRDGDGPGTLHIGPVGGTMMACPGEASSSERRFLRALEGSNRFSFLAGDLILSGDLEDHPDTLRFTPQPATK